MTDRQAKVRVLKRLRLVAAFTADTSDFTSSEPYHGGDVVVMVDLRQADRVALQMWQAMCQSAKPAQEPAKCTCPECEAGVPVTRRWL